MTKASYRDDMYDELMRVYREVCDTCEYLTQEEVFARTVEHGASRFYVDPRRALCRIYPLLHGDYSGLEQLSPLRQQLYRDLLEVVMRLSQQARYWNKSPYCIIRQAVLEPAPRFYIGVEQMRKVFKERRGRR